MEIYHSTAKTIFFLLQFYSFTNSWTKATSTTSIDTDHAALVAFRSQLDSESFQVLSHNWSDSSPVCTWVGITCGSLHQRVRALNISRMSLSGHIVPQLGNLSFLVSLDLSYNNFHDKIPKELTRLPRLRILDLSRNNISGEFPFSFGSFPRLRNLNMRNNTLTGVLSPFVANMSNIEVLDMTFNFLQGGIPPQIGNLQRLRVLGLQGNRLTGSVPPQLFNSKNLRVLALAFNRLQGSIPREIRNLTLLEELYLNNNMLTGELLSHILNISTLRVVSISENQISGNIPSNLGHSLPNMESLDLFTNNLTCESQDMSFITSLTNCRNLTRLRMSNNPLDGSLPSSIGNLSASLEFLTAYNCDLDGNIPPEIGNLTGLVSLRLFGNHLSGPLPETLSNLLNLQALVLHQNQINGTIPRTMCNFLYLYGLILNDNQIVGAIPDCLGNLTTLRGLELSNNKMNSTIPSSLWNIMDLQGLNLASNSFFGSLASEIRNLRAVNLIDLSMNQFSGIIPSSIGDLNTLSTLILNHNNFEGFIPESMAQMVSLRNLDMSHNNLSGPIPATLEKLQHLIQFNVSFNDLSGEIPSDGSFANFTSRSFLSNKGLCGDPKYQVPPCPINAERSKGKKKFLVVLIISVGLSGVIILLILAYAFAKCKRREAIPVTSFDSFGPTPARFSYYELRNATNGYDESNLLGSGSFGSVYIGALRNGKKVAVKVFNLQSESGSNSFEVECEILRKLRHRNLCKVIGSCCSQDFRALVLEYMPSGSLEKWLYSHNYFLDIVQRINIMIDIACALEYLHYGYSTPIVHCDLKPNNILLDEHMTARLCDFGIAKLLNDGESAVRTMTLATLGYIAPEFGLEGLVSTRCDVYSYGIVLMETFTRMSPNDDVLGGDLSLRSWVKDRMPDGMVHIIDSNLLNPDDEFSEEKLNLLSSIFELALSCTMESPNERINIKDVRVALEKIKHQLLAY